MTYIVIEGFYDLQDPEGRSFHLYNKGDIYPREGLEPTEERIKELSGPDNRRRQSLIEEVCEAIPEGEENHMEEAPAARKTRKR